MRTRLIIFDDTDPSQPTVAQSMDIPMEGVPDYGPSAGPSDVRVPGTQMRVRTVFLADDAPTPTLGYLNDLAGAIHTWAKGRGFWDASTNIGEKLALIHSEVSEALEEYRHAPRDAGTQGLIDWIAHLRAVQYDTAKPNEAGEPMPEGFGIELADAVIRILDLAGYLGVDIDAAVATKQAYNERRPYLHGKRV